ncbi:hypothetical protein [Enterococcus faecalis]|uniref:hypothetical protein n=1 Tax=Enterococcus faecalis TaxID=1351 RepID=UPI00203265C1|nr:hypothetical protein [Enterococcus faecalis]
MQTTFMKLAIEEAKKGAKKRSSADLYQSPSWSSDYAKGSVAKFKNQIQGL